MILKQLRSTDGTGSLAYIIASEKTLQAAVVDPNLSDVDLILKTLSDLGLTLTTIIDTHTHADHYSGSQILKERTGARIVMHKEAGEKWQSVHLGDAFGIGDILRANVKASIDRFVIDGDTIDIGGIEIKVIYTPGHANDHIALLAEGDLFTGDVLLIGQAGRSDLPGGNPEEQYDTLFKKLLSLPDDTFIHPAHDYEGNEYSTIGEEKQDNPFLESRSKAEYVAFVKDFFPPIADATANGVMLQCGTARVFDKRAEFGHVTPDELEAMIANETLLLLDVRNPDELKNFGAIDGVVNIPVAQLVRGGVDVEQFRDKKVVVVCHMGGRSAEAAHYLVSKGVNDIYNLTGGTLAWVRSGKPVSKTEQLAVS
jgi:glyoxylase-like metal-dependent hydrolase (beta-lactamase superfamily II)/rhodanese-related sulfurtransferase